MVEKINSWIDSHFGTNDNGINTVEEPPPIFKRWSRLYMIVIVNLALCLLTFYIIRKVFE